jgi:hypothetical protein
VDAAAFTGDAMEPHSLRHAVEAARARFGRIDVGYYGPADLGSLFGDITTLDGAGAEGALRGVVPAVEFASQLIPELSERGSGALLFAGRLIERGDIHQAMQANPDLFGAVTTLNPDDLADTLWRLYTERTEAEAVINALAA